MEDCLRDADDAADGVAALGLGILAHLDDLIGDIDLDGSEELLRGGEAGVTLAVAQHPLLGLEIDAQGSLVALDEQGWVVLTRCAAGRVDGPIDLFPHVSDLELDALECCHFVAPFALLSGLAVVGENSVRCFFDAAKVPDLASVAAGLMLLGLVRLLTAARVVDHSDLLLGLTDMLGDSVDEVGRCVDLLNQVHAYQSSRGWSVMTGVAIR